MNRSRLADLGVTACLVLALLGCKTLDKKNEPAPAPVAVTTAPAAASTAAPPAPPASSAPAPAAEVQNALASLFAGAPDDSVKFMGVRAAKGQPLTAKLPLAWSSSRDDPSTDYVDDELELYGPNLQAHAWLALTAKAATELEPKTIAFNSSRLTGKSVTYGPALEGVLGADNLPAMIAEGTGRMAGKPAEFWYALATLPNGKGLVVFAGVHSDAAPKRKTELVSALRSLRFKG